MNNKLVSIISPCYNEEKYIENFLESVINQTYRPIELILVNDGSTDNTDEIIKSYQLKLKENNIVLKYFTQENKGQAACINVGLKNYTGSYMMWFDSDDILLENNVSDKVNFLEKNSNYGFALGKGIVVDSNDTDTQIGLLERHFESNDDLFSDLIYEHNVFFCPGAIIASRKAIEQSIPSNHIYESREGQNWQLMLPLAYNYKCGYIDKILFKCVSHSDSHSRQARTTRELINRQKNFEKLLINTIQNIVQMPNNEKKRWISKIIVKHHTNILRLSIEKRNLLLYIFCLIKIKLNGGSVSKELYLSNLILNKIKKYI